MLTFPYLLSWPQRRSGRWPGIIVSLCLACFFCLTTARLAYAQQFITVNTTVLTVDGTTGSVAALLADPGRDGNISLAEAVAAINNTGPGHTIRFAPALGKGATIYFTAPVILTANNTAINGDFDQDDRPDIVLDGPDNGFTLVIRSSGNRLVNLAFIGVVIEGAAAQNNEIVRNYIGTDVTGLAARPQQRFMNGLLIRNGARGTQISGNHFAGVLADDNPNDSITPFMPLFITNAHANVVTGNRFGLNAADQPLGNKVAIQIANGSRDNIIGGLRSGEACDGPCNIIGNSSNVGVFISGGTNNQVLGNYIGIGPDGRTRMGNDSGVQISGGVNNRVGQRAANTAFCTGGCNLIGANEVGVWLWGSATLSNTISGNYIGVSLNSSQPISNIIGVRMADDASQNVIGGVRTGQECNGPCNLISGNGYGVEISNGASENAVRGNYIGADRSGTDRLPNSHSGVVVIQGAKRNQIGGYRSVNNCTGECNLISGNSVFGVLIYHSGTDFNWVFGNYVGTDINGLRKLGNGDAGVAVGGSAVGNIVGGQRGANETTCVGPCNVISGNGRAGVYVYDNAVDTLVYGNFIGVDAIAQAPLGNTTQGVLIFNGATGTYVGLGNRTGFACTDACNIIGGNGRSGVGLLGATTQRNVIMGNFIGRANSNAQNLGNNGAGVGIAQGASNNVIGFSSNPTGCASACNVIWYNQGNGVLLFGNTSKGNTIRGNSIFQNGAIAIDLGNDTAADGVTLNDTGDGDDGPNNLLNAPLSLLAEFDGRKTRITGVIHSQDLTNTQIDIYSNESYNSFAPTGNAAHGEAEAQFFVGTATWLNPTTFQLELDGNLTFGSEDGLLLPFVTATATDANGNTSELSTRTPTIFIPGAGGSELQADGGQAWINCMNYVRQLRIDPGDNPDNPTNRPVVATKVIGSEACSLVKQEIVIYGPLLGNLAAQGYHATDCRLDNRGSRNKLFTFPYDWRLSNTVNAGKLKTLVDCIQTMYPGSRVNLLTHSMGGLLARSYLLQNPSNHRVGRMVSLGTPWLGAPKALSMMLIGDLIPQILTWRDVKYATPSFPAIHQLLPSTYYFDAGGQAVLVERGGDLNRNGSRYDRYGNSALLAYLNRAYSDWQPSRAHVNFWTAEQADWRNDRTGVSYVDLYAIQKAQRTPGTLAYGKGAACRGGLFAGDPDCHIWEDFGYLAYVRGDGTVPTLSTTRPGLRAPRSELIPLYSPNAESDPLYDHTDMTGLPTVAQIIAARLNYLCTAGSACQQQEPWLQMAEANFAVEAESDRPSVFDVKLYGAPALTIQDSQRATVRTGGQNTLGFMAGLQLRESSERAWELGLYGNKSVTVTFTSDATPLHLEVVTSNAVTTLRAVRYLDLEVAAGLSVTLFLKNDGAIELLTDNDGNGRPETVITPTVDLRGAGALDREAPLVTVTTSGPETATQVTLSASDAGSGVQHLFYALTGSRYQRYTAPFTINLNDVPTFSVLAQDNAGNRQVEEIILRDQTPPSGKLLTVQVIGNGTVTGNGITCGADCSERLPDNSQVTLTAQPATGQRFVGWGGACSGAATCTITMESDKTVTATFAAAPVRYTLTVQSSANGKITGPGLDCGADCSEQFDAGAQVTLSAVPANGYRLAAWSGACTGNGACVVTMNSDISVAATFEALPAQAETISLLNTCGQRFCQPYDLTIGPDGAIWYNVVNANKIGRMAANGQVQTFNLPGGTNGWDRPQGITAGPDGAIWYTRNGAQRVGRLALDGTTTEWPLQESAYPDDIIVGPDGALWFSQFEADKIGRITVDGVLSEFVLPDTPNPADGSTKRMPKTLVVGSDGAIWFSVNSAVGRITLDGQVTLYWLQASDLYGSPRDITRGPDGALWFTANFGSTSLGRLTTAGQFQRFEAENWYNTFEGIAVGSDGALWWADGHFNQPNLGRVTVDGQVSRIPLPNRFQTKANTLISAPDGSLWFAEYGAGTLGRYRLSAAANFTLTTGVNGNGAINGPGITCGADCSESYGAGKLVALTATPAPGHRFAGWGGMCSGNGACYVSLISGAQVSATFVADQPVTHELRVQVNGSGVVSGPGINCGADCAESYLARTTVNLTATATTGWNFLGWSGACTGVNTCQVTMDGAKQVTALFERQPDIRYGLTVGKNGQGTITGQGIDCGSDCEEIYPAGTQVTLVATPAAGFQFTGWTSDRCSGMGNCVVTMDAAFSVTANFTPLAQTRITIVLDTVPDSIQNIRFTGTAPIGRFLLDDITPQDTDAFSNSRSFTVQPGSYTITETIPTNRLLRAITCTGGNPNVNLAQGAVTLQINSNEEITCTFINERPATIRGLVYEDRNRNGRRNAIDPFLADWPLSVYISGTQTLVAEGRTSGSTPLVSFNRLLAGAYTLCAPLPAGWANSDPAAVTPPYNLPCRSLSVLPGQVATLRFGVYQQAVLTAEATVEDEAGEESVVYSEEADSEEENSAADEQWLAEEPTTDAVMRIFLPVVSR